MAMEALETFPLFDFEWERTWVVAAISLPDAYSFAKGVLGVKVRQMARRILKYSPPCSRFRLGIAL
jgi:hypothetical protein